MRLRVALGVVLVSVSGLAHAIVSRHDADTVATDKQATRFAAVCKILPDGEGVLIAPRWVLTAAHVATGAPRERLRAQLLGVEYRVAEVIAYPDWRPGKTDLALMRLAAPVQQVAPLELSNADLAVGTEVLLAGRGDYGDGQRGVVGNDGKLRVANNAVSKIEPERLFIRLDAPEDGALDAEGVSGPGDSGTPALVERDGRLEVVGIGSVGVSPKPRPYGEYGSQDVFIRTSHFAEWILEEQSR